MKTLKNNILYLMIICLLAVLLVNSKEYSKEKESLKKEHSIEIKTLEKDITKLNEEINKLNIQIKEQKESISITKKDKDGSSIKIVKKNTNKEIDYSLLNNTKFEEVHKESFKELVKKDKEEKQKTITKITTSPWFWVVLSGVIYIYTQKK